MCGGEAWRKQACRRRDEGRSRPLHAQRLGWASTLYRAGWEARGWHWPGWIDRQAAKGRRSGTVEA